MTVESVWSVRRFCYQRKSAKSDKTGRLIWSYRCYIELSRNEETENDMSNSKQILQKKVYVMFLRSYIDFYGLEDPK